MVDECGLTSAPTTYYNGKPYIISLSHGHRQLILSQPSIMQLCEFTKYNAVLILFQAFSWRRDGPLFEGQSVDCVESGIPNLRLQKHAPPDHSDSRGLPKSKQQQADTAAATRVKKLSFQLDYQLQRYWYYAVCMN